MDPFDLHEVIIGHITPEICRGTGTVQGKSFVANNKLQSLLIRALYEACKPLFD